MLASTATAHACMGRQFERYVLLDNRPNEVPPGAVVMRVRVAQRDIAEADSGPVLAKILKPASAFPGATQVLIEGGHSSCSRWGRLDKGALVVGFPRRAANGRMFLAAIEYGSLTDPDATPRYRRRPEDLDKYIVDPAYLPAEP